VLILGGEWYCYDSLKKISRKDVKSIEIRKINNSKK
jgi:hypothetical protein